MHLVKQIACVLLLAVTVCFVVAPARADSKELADLIGSLLPREHLAVDIALLQAKNSSTELKRAATDELNKAKEGYGRLRTFFRKDTSIFDYPGLLALGRPNYVGSDDTYTLLVGIPNNWGWDRDQGDYPYAFEIIFDHKGLITQINNVVLRH